ncbi:MAG: hypothetical protein JWQ19_4033, partial [Subtercola sp.]|nr:hypothetical protein [Subtercola sp.]
MQTLKRYMGAAVILLVLSSPPACAQFGTT